MPMRKAPHTGTYSTAKVFNTRAVTPNEAAALRPLCIAVRRLMIGRKGSSEADLQSVAPQEDVHQRPCTLLPIGKLPIDDDCNACATCQPIITHKQFSDRRATRVRIVYNQYTSSDCIELMFYPA